MELELPDSRPISRVLLDSPAHNVDRYVGCRALWMKVIIRAVFDWVSYRDSLKLEQRKEAEMAYRWIFLPSRLDNSFDDVCTLVDLSPEKIRRWARSLSKEQVTKIEHLEREGRIVSLMEAERRLIDDIEDGTD